MKVWGGKGEGMFLHNSRFLCLKCTKKQMDDSNEIPFAFAFAFRRTSRGLDTSNMEGFYVLASIGAF